MMIVTRDYILQHRTRKGAWTKAQMIALGVGWPQPRGWIDKTVGKEISAGAAELFESGKEKFGKKAKKQQARDLNDVKRVISEASYIELHDLADYLGHVIEHHVDHIPDY